MWRLRTLSYKKILFILIVLILIGLGVLWFIGKTNPNQVLTPEQEAVLIENAKITNIINSAGKTTGNFADFEPGKVAKVYKTADLNVLQDNTRPTIQTYSQDLKKALAPISLIDQNPIALLLIAIDSQNTEPVKKILTISSLYQTAVTQLVATSVPSTATVAHLRLINTLNELYLITSAMAEIQTEPLKATQAGEYFSEAFKTMLSDFNFINKYFQNSGIIFDDKNKIIFVDFTLQ